MLNDGHSSQCSLAACLAYLLSCSIVCVAREPSGDGVNQAGEEYDSEC